MIKVLSYLLFFPFVVFVNIHAQTKEKKDTANVWIAPKSVDILFKIKLKN